MRQRLGEHYIGNTMYARLQEFGNTLMMRIKNSEGEQIWLRWWCFVYIEAHACLCLSTCIFL